MQRRAPHSLRAISGAMLFVLVACRGSVPSSHAPAPTPASPEPADPVTPPPEPAPAELSNVEPPREVDVIRPDAAPCPRQCMDICCQADEICQHGRGDDGTRAHCRRRPRR